MPPEARALAAAPFPALADSATLGRHGRLAGQFAAFLARGDRRAAGDWLRRLAREPDVSPWLLIDQLASLPPAASRTAPRARKAGAGRALAGRVACTAPPLLLAGAPGNGGEQA